MIGEYHSLGRITDEENNALRDHSGTQRCGHRLRIRQKDREQCGEHCGGAVRGRFDAGDDHGGRDNSGGCFGHGGEVAPGNTQYPQKLAENLSMTVVCARSDSGDSGNRPAGARHFGESGRKNHARQDQGAQLGSGHYGHAGQSRERSDSARFHGYAARQQRRGAV